MKTRGIMRFYERKEKTSQRCLLLLPLSFPSLRLTLLSFLPPSSLAMFALARTILIPIHITRMVAIYLYCESIFGATSQNVQGISYGIPTEGANAKLRADLGKANHSFLNIILLPSPSFHFVLLLPLPYRSPFPTPPTFTYVLSVHKLLLLPSFSSSFYLSFSSISLPSLFLPLSLFPHNSLPNFSLSYVLQLFCLNELAS